MTEQEKINEIADYIFRYVKNADFDDVGEAAVAIFRAIKNWHKGD